MRRLSTVIKAADGIVKKKASSVRRTILLDDRFVEKRRNMVSILSYHHHYRHRQHIVEMDDANDNDVAQALYQKAIDSIKAYRRHLNDDELVEFDKQWDCYFPDSSSSSSSSSSSASGTGSGSSASGSASGSGSSASSSASGSGTGSGSNASGNGSGSGDTNSSSNDASGGKSSSGSRYDQFSQPLYNKICHIQELGSEDHAYLKDIPSHVCGVEIMKAFFVDLLGIDYYYDYYYYLYYQYLLPSSS